MNCTACGEICRCANKSQSAASSRWVASPESFEAEPLEAEQQETGGTTETLLPAVDPALAKDITEVPENSSAWRQELADRLNRYQSRRKPRPPRYPSLRLRLEDAGKSANAVRPDADDYLPIIATSSNHALALDHFAGEPADDHAVDAFRSPKPSEVEALSEDRRPAAITPPLAKIIEFPRFWMPPAPRLDELAEPVAGRPRILEAPEVVPPPPALGGISIDPAPRPALEKRPGIDFPLQAGSLSRRILSAAIDDLIIVAASALFGFVFWKMTPIRVPMLHLLSLGVVCSAVFWGIYQYLLIVYSGSTPGLRLARLRLARFDGSGANRRRRRWRVLASFLSAISLGMGYAWAFLDEDGLCWHDRITHTYLAPEPPNRN